MVKRVFINDQTMKVSKPGIDVTTTTSPQDLLFESGRSAMGSYNTGQIIPTNSGWKPFGSYGTCRVPFPSPGGYVPMVLLQQSVNANSTVASGARVAYDSTTYRESIDIYDGGGRPQFYTWTEYNIYDRLTWAIEKSALTAYVGLGMFSMPLRYHVFYVKATDDIYAGQDITPNPVEWADNIGTAKNVYTGTGMILGLADGVRCVLGVSSTLAGSANGAVKAFVIRGSDTFVYTLNTGETKMYFDVQNSDGVYFGLQGSDNTTVYQSTLTITNESETPPVTLDTVTLTTNTIDRTPNPVDWTTVSGTLLGQSNSQTITGISAVASLFAEFSPVYSGKFGMMSASYYLDAATKSLSLNVSNGTSVYWTFRPYSSYSGTVTIKNSLDANAVLDTFPVNITVPANTINVDWSSIHQWDNTISGQSITVAGLTETAKMTNFTGTKTLSVTLSPGISSGGLERFRIYKNGVSTEYTSGSSFSVSITNGDTLAFYASSTGTFASYSGTCTVKDGTTTLDTFGIDLMIEVTDPPGCVVVESWMPGGVQARDAYVGMPLRTLAIDHMGLSEEEVVLFLPMRKPAVRLTSTSGVVLECSTCTPIEAPDGTCVMADVSLGHPVAVEDENGFRWEAIASVEDIGERDVARISASGPTHVYAAGKENGRWMYTHNVGEKP